MAVHGKVGTVRFVPACRGTSRNGWRDQVWTGEASVWPVMAGKVRIGSARHDAVWRDRVWFVVAGMARRGWAWSGPAGIGTGLADRD